MRPTQFLVVGFVIFLMVFFWPLPVGNRTSTQTKLLTPGGTHAFNITTAMPDTIAGQHSLLPDFQRQCSGPGSVIHFQNVSGHLRLYGLCSYLAQYRTFTTSRDVYVSNLLGVDIDWAGIGWGVLIAVVLALFTVPFLIIGRILWSVEAAWWKRRRC